MKPTNANSQMHAKEMLSEEQKQFSRIQLRSARDAALADAEGFQAVIHSLELMGQQLAGEIRNGLGNYKNELKGLAEHSPLSLSVDLEQLNKVHSLPLHCFRQLSLSTDLERLMTYHTSFCDLFDELKDARNDAVHQGAYARILTDHAVELAIILEDALMSKFSRVSQFMVRDVVEAKPWQPVSYVRQQMLKHSFSYIPIRHGDTWKLISEHSVAQYLRGAPSKTKRRKRLAAKIENSLKENNENDRLCAPKVANEEIVSPEDSISKILKRIKERPLLVVNHGREDVLAGILTSADIL